MCETCAGTGQVFSVKNGSRSTRLTCARCVWGLPVFDWERVSVPFVLTEKAEQYLDGAIA